MMLPADVDPHRLAEAICKDELDQQWESCDVCAAEENKAPEGQRIIAVDLASVRTLSEEAFPLGEVLSCYHLSPTNDGDDCDSMLVRIDGMVEDRAVLVAGHHMAGAYNDDEYNATFSGRIHLVPPDQAEAVIAQISAGMAHEAVSDLANEIEKNVRKLAGFDANALDVPVLKESLAKLCRALAAMS